MSAMGIAGDPHCTKYHKCLLWKSEVLWVKPHA